MAEGKPLRQKTGEALKVLLVLLFVVVVAVSVIFAQRAKDTTLHFVGGLIFGIFVAVVICVLVIASSRRETDRLRTDLAETKTQLLAMMQKPQSPNVFMGNPWGARDMASLAPATPPGGYGYGDVVEGQTRRVPLLGDGKDDEEPEWGGGWSRTW